jgi:hypothetical protein
MTFVPIRARNDGRNKAYVSKKAHTGTCTGALPIIETSHVPINCKCASESQHSHTMECSAAMKKKILPLSTQEHG